MILGRRVAIAALRLGEQPARLKEFKETAHLIHRLANCDTG